MCTPTCPPLHLIIPSQLLTQKILSTETYSFVKRVVSKIPRFRDTIPPCNVGIARRHHYSESIGIQKCLIEAVLEDGSGFLISQFLNDWSLPTIDNASPRNPNNPPIVTFLRPATVHRNPDQIQDCDPLCV